MTERFDPATFFDNPRPSAAPPKAAGIKVEMHYKRPTDDLETFAVGYLDVSAGRSVIRVTGAFRTDDPFRCGATITTATAPAGARFVIAAWDREAAQLSDFGPFEAWG